MSVSRNVGPRAERKAGAEHYGVHLDRLRDWVAEVVDLRTRPQVDEWEG